MRNYYYRINLDDIDWFHPCFFRYYISFLFKTLTTIELQQQKLQQYRYIESAKRTIKSLLAIRMYR